MKQRLLAALSRLDPRLLLGLLALITALAALEGWLLVLRKPLAEYRALVSTRESLAQANAAAPNQQGELGRLAADFRLVSARLTGQLRAPVEPQMVSMVLRELDRLATQHGITLAGVRPGPRREVLGFQEISFDVSAQGAYLSLCNWLMDFERALGQSATVSEFSMKAAEQARVALELRLRLYRPMSAEAAK